MLGRLMLAVERILALAFIFAVCLNFANVVGRYGFGYSISGADEIQIYIMVWMAFLGAAVVAWRREHLRMDVLRKLFPERIQLGLQLLEGLILVALAGFTLVQSWRYTAQMAALGRTSDVGDIPIWIPHGGVALGFALIALIALVQLFRPR